MADPEAALNYLPKTLQEVLFTRKNTKMKQASIGQAIIQGTRPRAILAPLQFGLGMIATFTPGKIISKPVPKITMISRMLAISIILTLAGLLE